MNIRVGTINDLKEIQELNLLLFAEEFYWDITLDLGWTFSELGTAYFKSAISSECSCVYVACDGFRVVGYVVGSEAEPVAYRQGHRPYELNDMYVLKQFRSKGIGKQLYGAFYNWGIDHGANSWKIHVTFQNKEAIKFYKKMGLSEGTIILER